MAVLVFFMFVAIIVAAIIKSMMGGHGAGLETVHKTNTATGAAVVTETASGASVAVIETAPERELPEETKEAISVDTTSLNTFLGFMSDTAYEDLKNQLIQICQDRKCRSVKKLTYQQTKAFDVTSFVLLSDGSVYQCSYNLKSCQMSLSETSYDEVAVNQMKEKELQEEQAKLEQQQKAEREKLAKKRAVHKKKKVKKKPHKKKKDKKPKKGEKLINYSHSDTYYLLDKYKDGADCDRDRMMFTLQALFNALVVIPSIDSGFIDKNNLILSADGSSLHIHSSPFGHKVLDGDDSDNIYRFSAPDADIGWDSDLESFYLGYTFYNISYHNPLKNIDLPVFASIENASRHDALSCISAAAQFLDMNHDLHPKYFCHDSAADSLPVFQFFQHNNIIPVIDHNPRRDSSKEYVEKNHTNNDGIPVCMANRPMHFCGYDIQRCRKKYRCPLVMGDISSCPFVDQCSTSSYGRISYIIDGDSARNAGPLSYKSETWKKIYRNRTSTERINNRVLTHYPLHQMMIRNKDKHAFFTIFACINIHLDAWIKDSV